MPRKLQDYRNAAIAVTFEPGLCIHSANCLRGHPGVFDVRRRHWIDVDAASPDEIATVVERCPSGALRYERLDGGPAEQPATELSVQAMRDGPLWVRGDLHIVDAGGGTIRDLPRAALCRCGQSANKPFCDNTHLTSGFRAP